MSYSTRRFRYDKDYYLSSTLYSNFIDNEIKKYKIDKINKKKNK